MTVALTAGGASVFFGTAYQAYLPSVVDKGELTEANAKLLGAPTGRSTRSRLIFHERPPSLVRATVVVPAR